MTHGTTQGPHVPLWGQFTTHTTRAGEKLKKKCFFSLFILSFPPVHDRGPRRPKLFFFRKKNPTWSRKIEGNREMSSPGVGKVTKVVPHWSKDYHTTVSTMDTDNVGPVVVRRPGSCGQFETGETVQTISRAPWVFFTGREGAQGEGHTWQPGRQRGGQEILGEWSTWRWRRRGKFWQKGSCVTFFIKPRVFLSHTSIFEMSI